jgi:hypothetical protein
MYNGRDSNGAYLLAEDAARRAAHDAEVAADLGALAPRHLLDEVELLREQQQALQLPVRARGRRTREHAQHALAHLHYDTEQYVL